MRIENTISYVLSLGEVDMGLSLRIQIYRVPIESRFDARFLPELKVFILAVRGRDGGMMGDLPSYITRRDNGYIYRSNNI